MTAAFGALAWWLLALASAGYENGSQESVAEVARQEVQTTVQRVNVTAERFHFTPSRIKTTAGTRLEIELASNDVEHGFTIIDTDIEVRIPEAGMGRVIVVFDPPAPGRYRFQCSHQCGSGHASMSGVIVVREGPRND